MESSETQGGEDFEPETIGRLAQTIEVMAATIAELQLQNTELVRIIVSAQEEDDDGFEMPGTLDG